MNLSCIYDVFKGNTFKNNLVHTSINKNKEKSLFTNCFQGGIVISLECFTNLQMKTGKKKYSHKNQNKQDTMVKKKLLHRKLIQAKK